MNWFISPSRARVASENSVFRANQPANLACFVDTFSGYQSFR